MVLLTISVLLGLKRGKRALWSEEDLGSAMTAVKEGDMTQKEAAKQYGIPKSTLSDHLKSGVYVKRMGRNRRKNIY